jgi:ribokinase
VIPDETEASAIGNITLEIGEDGGSRNRIIVVPGANMTITPEDIAFLKTTSQITTWSCCS